MASYRSKLFFMFMMFMWVASTTPLTGFNFNKNPILMPVYLIILAYYYVKYCHRSYTPLKVWIGIFALWYLASCMKWGSILPFYFQPIYSIIIVFVAFNLFYEDEFLALFEKVLVALCLLSLIVWILVNIIPGIMVPFMHAIAVIENNPPTEANCFIVGIGDSEAMGIRRNIGFTWEPGKFSCFCIMGLYVNLVRNHFFISYKKNKNFWILLIALFSSLSTTGYATAGMIALFYVWNKRGVSRVFATILIIMLIPTVAGLSFMGEKITELLDIGREIKAVEHYANNGMEQITPQRFGGFLFEWMNLIHDPLLGFYTDEYSYATRVLFNNSAVVTVSDGILRILARYGIFVGLFFYYFLFKSSCFLAKVYNYKGWFFFAVIFMTMSISYDFWENCLMMYFYLSTFFMHYSDKYFIDTNIQNNQHGHICNYNLL